VRFRCLCAFALLMAVTGILWAAPRSSPTAEGASAPVSEAPGETLSAEPLPAPLSGDGAALSAGDSSSDVAPSPAVPLGPEVASVDVQGNETVVAAHILSVVQTKVGEPLDEEKLRRDVETIFDLGFFESVDFKVEERDGRSTVLFLVKENPVVKEVKFVGNSVYSEAQLREVCFTTPGNIFNRVFFKNDLQRIKEKYQKDGYVLTRVQDVLVEDGVVTVVISEPKVGEIIIQGNKKTKKRVIERYIRLKPGEIFNANKLRLSLNKLQGLGYFEDVSVGFEPNQTDPEKVDLVLTVQEGKTGKVGFDVGYGTSSGFSGGINYADTNWQGLGNKVSVGFDVGDREQYWLSYENPFMSQTEYAWKVGIYKRQWKNLDYNPDERDVDQDTFEYDQTKIGGYLGIGRKFRGNDKLSWFFTLDWHKVENTIDDGYVPTQHQMEELSDGTNFSATLALSRNNVDEYTPYPKGDIETVNVEQGFSALGGDWSYTKYWGEVRWYYPFGKLLDMFETSLPDTEDNPPIFAVRVRAGSSGGYVPWSEQYTVGGTNTLRGYDEDYFRGDEMFLANLEVRVPVQKSFSLVVFYDTGNAWDTTIGESFSFSDLYDGKGVGVRVKTPLGNIRLDFASGEEESKTHFGFNEMF